MNRTSTFLVAALLGACSTDTDLTNRPLFDNGVNVFEANVLDGLTGATVENATVSVQIGRHTLSSSPQAEGDGSGAQSSFFSIYGIPYGEFRVVATAEGYNDFVALRDFDNGSPSDSLADGDPYIYYFNNILMFPSGTVPSDVTVSVYDNNTGAAVKDATVVASLDANDTFLDITNALYPDFGLKPKTFADKTGTDGKVTLSAANLVMGGDYEVAVYGALDASGVSLVPSGGYGFTAGVDIQNVVVFLEKPNANLVAIKANNEASNAVTPNLQITFPYPVEQCMNFGTPGWYNYGSSGALAATPAVTVALSAGDTVATLTANVQSGTDNTAYDFRLAFHSVYLKPKGASDNSCRDPYDDCIELRNTNTCVDSQITVRDVP